MVIKGMHVGALTSLNPTGLHDLCIYIFISALKSNNLNNYCDIKGKIRIY
jgi:hypothetical protein